MPTATSTNATDRIETPLYRIVETCPKCGGKLRVIACIENPDVIATILEHIRVRKAATTANPRAPPLNTELPAARYQDRLP